MAENPPCEKCSDHAIVINFIQDIFPSFRKDLKDEANNNDKMFEQLFNLQREGQMISVEISSKMGNFSRTIDKIDKYSDEINRLNSDIVKLRESIFDKLHQGELSLSVRFDKFKTDEIIPLQDAIVDNDEIIKRIKNIAIGIAIGSGLGGAGIGAVFVKYVLPHL